MGFVVAALKENHARVTTNFYTPKRLTFQPKMQHLAVSHWHLAQLIFGWPRKFVAKC
jgi:hypothetical protein